MQVFVITNNVRMMINIHENAKNWLIKVYVIKHILGILVILSANAKCVCSYAVCIVLGVIALTICIGIGAYFTYKYINRKKENVSKCDYVYHTKNY